MNSETTAVAEQYRTQQWISLIQNCQSRPRGTKIEDWCLENGITRDAYYYWLRKLRKACLASSEKKKEPVETLEIVPVSLETMSYTPSANDTTDDFIELSSHGVTIHVTSKTSMGLLSKVLDVISHAE